MRAVGVVAALALAGCNIVPPLDCLAGVVRAGCQRDANGEYGYLYRSAITPNGKYDVPGPAYVPEPAPMPTFSGFGAFRPQVHTTCTGFGNQVNCTSY